MANDIHEYDKWVTRGLVGSLRLLELIAYGKAYKLTPKQKQILSDCAVRLNDAIQEPKKGKGGKGIKIDNLIVSTFQALTDLIINRLQQTELQPMHNSAIQEIKKTITSVEVFKSLL